MGGRRVKSGQKDRLGTQGPPQFEAGGVEGGEGTAICLCLGG